MKFNLDIFQISATLLENFPFIDAKELVTWDEGKE